MTGISQQFCVRWNSHLGSLGAAFPQLLAGQQFVDVTLACDGHQVHCHRLVLAACSSYFESLLSENPCKHPIIILPKDIKLWEIHALVDFMYKGQVNVSQAGLPQLLKCAETLQIRGLCGTESTLNEVANGKIERCDPNVVSNNCSQNLNFSSLFASNLLNANYQSDDEISSFRQQYTDLQRAAFVTGDNAKTIVNNCSNENLVKTKPNKNQRHEKLTKEHSNAIINTTKRSLKRCNENEVSNTESTELNIKCEELDSDAIAADEGMDDELDEHSNSKQSEYTLQQNDAVIDNDSVILGDGTGDTTIVPSNVIESNPHTPTDILSAENDITITQSESNDNATVCYSPSWSLPADLNEHNSSIADSNHNIDDDVSSPILPTSLKFDRNTMSISVKRCATKSVRFEQQFDKSHTNSDMIDDDDENITCSAKFGPNESMDSNHSIQLESNTTPSKFDHFNFDARNPNDNYEQLYQSITTNNDVDDELKNDESSNDRLMELLRCKDPLRSAVVLRSPRGNQPRTYTTDALYSALMDVKSGESIYRASQLHGVPRKTLRNWMKRWHIKSVFPMPYQLKKAAEKKRLEIQQNVVHTSTTTQYAMANVVCEYANDSPTRPTSSAAGSIEEHPDYSSRSMSPSAKRFVNDSSYFSGMSEPGRRIRRSESLLRQAADNVSKGQTFQTVSDMFQIPISTIRFFMARKGILPKRKRGRASIAPDIEDVNHSPHQRQIDANDADSCNTNTVNTEQP